MRGKSLSLFESLSLEMFSNWKLFQDWHIKCVGNPALDLMCWVTAWLQSLWKPCAISPSGDLCNLHMKHNGIFCLFLHCHLHGISSCICKCSKIWTNSKAKVFLVLNISNKGYSTCFLFWNLLENTWLDSILLLKEGAAKIYVRG